MELEYNDKNKKSPTRGERQEITCADNVSKQDKTKKIIITALLFMIIVILVINPYRKKLEGDILEQRVLAHEQILVVPNESGHYYIENGIYFFIREEEFNQV